MPFLGLDGVPVRGGSIHVYDSLSGARIAAYVLDAEGQADVRLGRGAYRLELKDQKARTIWVYPSEQYLALVVRGDA